MEANRADKDRHLFQVVLIIYKPDNCLHHTSDSYHWCLLANLRLNVCYCMFYGELAVFFWFLAHTAVRHVRRSMNVKRAHLRRPAMRVPSRSAAGVPPTIPTVPASSGVGPDVIRKTVKQPEP